MSKKGYFAKFGGRFVPEVLQPALDQLEKTYKKAKSDKKFWAEFKKLSETYSCRPTPFYSTLRAHHPEHAGRNARAG